MRGTAFRLDVVPAIPERLKRLEELAGSQWYSWDGPTRSLFAQLSPALWQAVGHSPKAFLRSIDQKRLLEAENDAGFLAAFDRVLAAYDRYHAARPAGFRGLEPGDVVAYFCAEFGLHESLPIYSGGLGVLAGDHTKTASDIGMPFVGVGLLYRQGYFVQTIDSQGRQEARHVDIDFDRLPIEPALGPDGRELRVPIDMPGRKVQANVWRAKVGHVMLYLLDTDIEGNDPRDRGIGYQLYGGTSATRLEQELVLGVGGARALAAVGIEPACWHVNEGHAAFLVVERVRRLVAGGLEFAAALEAVAANTVFTTHTVVPAGHDHFPEEAVRAYLASACPELAPSLDAILALARSSSAHDFNMTSLALQGSRYQNGVSRIHGRISSRLCAECWPQIEPEENPLRSITNGVHVPTFLHAAWTDVYDRHLGPEWRTRLTDAAYWRKVRDIPDAEFWAVHQGLKKEMLQLVSHRMRTQNARHQGSDAHLDRVLRLADPDQPGVLTIGFARRIATYKRATLLFHDLDRLREMVCDARRPVLFVLAGKAHPADQPAQDLIRRISEVARMPEFERSFLFVENYDLRIARRLVSGVDVWLNNPIYPHEASGTSGMKAGINGVINLSVLDGWWAEGYDGGNGWAIKPAFDALDAARRDTEEARALYQLLEEQVIPLYYAAGPDGCSPGWLAIAKQSVASIVPRFSSARMLAEYGEQCYVPAARQWRRFSQDRFSAARTLAAWKAAVRRAWPGVRVRRVDTPVGRLRSGEKVRLEVAAKLNGLGPHDIAVEVLLGRPEAELASDSLSRVRLPFERALAESDEHLFALDFA
ncbi:MAG TPA: alpha-glucan family phosphorylase, partial [Burkholderiales bacterium]|nr:alpha-glucan family phosphorylase [Burkholderiales bacterium]